MIQRIGQRLRARMLAVFASGLIVHPGAGSAWAQMPASDLPALQRVVRQFDFEEAELAPYEMPLTFYRYVAPDQGFPPHGTMGLNAERSRRGRWSFQFTPDGGSVAARIPTGVIPVLPGADYAVSVWLRTEGLAHARARLVAYFTDGHGRIIAASRRETPVSASPDDWRQLRLTVYGEFDDAADLIVELQVLQPDQFLDASRHPIASRLRDVTGHAWFDDLVVRNAPRIDLHTTAADNVFVRPDPPALRLVVRDLVAGEVMLDLEVRDVDGSIVHERRFAAPRNRKPFTEELAVDRCGWYEARVMLTADAEILAERMLDFLVMPGPVGRDATAELGLTIPELPARKLREGMSLARRLDLPNLIVPAWQSEDDEADRAEWTRTLREEIERTIGPEATISISLNHVPPTMRSALGLDESMVLDLLTEPDDLWRPSLDDLLTHFGRAIHRWQIGETGARNAAAHPDLQAAYRSIRAEMSQFIARPVVCIPWSVEQSPPPTAEPECFNLRIPPSFPPRSIARALQPWQARGGEFVLTLEPLPEDLFSPRERTIDLVLRGLEAWRAGVDGLTVVGPWRWLNERAPVISPAPAALAWAQLARRLGGRTFVSEMRLGDDVHCWILSGPSPQDGALVLWSDGDERSIEQAADVLRSHCPFRAVDVFGNAWTVEDAEGPLDLPIGRTPIFIEGVDTNLALFQQSITFAPDSLPALRRIHEHDVVLMNPWAFPISGTIMLDPHDELRVAPRTSEFHIPPSGSARLPVQVLYERSRSPGRVPIRATIELRGDGRRTVWAVPGLDVGFRDVEFQATWHPQRNETTGRMDVAITTRVTNRGTDPIDLNLYIVSPRTQHQRDTISSLRPGATNLRTFVIPDGLAKLAGSEVRAGIAGRSVPAHLSQTLSIPPVNTRVTRVDEGT